MKIQVVQLELQSSANIVVILKFVFFFLTTLKLFLLFKVHRKTVTLQR